MRWDGLNAVHLLTAYAKAERENLTLAGTKTLSRPVGAIRKETM